MSNCYTEFSTTFGDDWSASQRDDFVNIVRQINDILEEAAGQDCDPENLVDDAFPTLHREIMREYFSLIRSDRGFYDTESLDLNVSQRGDYLECNSENTEITEEVPEFIRIFLEKNGIPGYIVIEMSHSCDRLRPNEFGGSVVFITKDGIKWKGTSEIVSEWINEHEANYPADSEEKKE